MRTQVVWYVALCMCLALNCCDCSKHNNHNKARSKHTTEDEPEGKIFGWKKQPQTNFIFLTPPTAVAAAPTTTSSLSVSVPAAAAAATTTAARRPIIQRYGGLSGYRGYRRRVPQAQRYRVRQQPWRRRLIWPQYGREDKQETEMLPDDSPATYTDAGVEVNAKLDVEQLEKSLGRQHARKHNYAGQIMLNANDRNKVERLKTKSQKPQTTAILQATMPATVTTTTTTDNEPTYAEAVVQSNDNNNNNEASNGNKRQSIWQTLSERWRERRRRRNQQQQPMHKVEEVEEEEQEQEEDENTEKEIFIDENGKIHIKKQRNNNNKKNNKNMQKKQQKQRRRKQQAVANKKKQQKNESNVISANNTNSRFQNIMNAFRRTPIIYKQQGR